MIRLRHRLELLAPVLFAAIPGGGAQASIEQLESTAPSTGSDAEPAEGSFDGVSDQGRPASAGFTAAMETGLSSPYAMSARVLPGRSWARAVGGYDAATQSFRLRSSTETAVSSYLAIRVDFEHGPSTSTTDRVSLGLRLAVLHQEAHGVDLGLGMYYQPNDFRTEGNIVGAVMLGRRFDRVTVAASALLGSDSEGDDQEIDGRLATTVVVLPYLQLGLDNRLRTMLSTDRKTQGTTTVDWELAVLPNATVTLGPIVLIAEVGLSSLQVTDFSRQPNQRKNLHTGVMVMSGLGLAF